MRKTAFSALTVCLTIAVLVAAASCSKSNAQKQPENVTVNMFQLKVEIKDALDAYAAKYTAAHPGVTVKAETLGGGGDYGGAMKAKVQAGQMPDIFMIEGMGGYEIWKEYIADLSAESWVKDTDLALNVDPMFLTTPSIQN